MNKLFVGDVSEYLAEAAVNHDPLAVLLTDKNYNVILSQDYKRDNFFSSDTFYTSISDMGSMENLIKVLMYVDEIIYLPPTTWSDSNSDGSAQKEQLEMILRFVSQYKPVSGENFSSKKNKFLSEDFICDKRKTEDTQFWAVGCSVTYGEGVSIQETWKHIVSQRLGLPYSDLSFNGSSIIWQSDQICRADIRKDDLVFWGLTAQSRLPLIDDRDHKLLHLTAGVYHKDIHYTKTFPPELIDNSSIYWHNVMAVRRVSNYCRKVGAKLVILGLLPDVEQEIWLHYGVKEFHQLMIWPMRYVDLGRDNVHPGPKQHAIFADRFIEFYNKLYQT